MISLEQTDNWAYLLLRGRMTELKGLRFSLRFTNEDDTKWFVGDSPQPTKGFNTAPFQMLVPAGLRLALPRVLIESIPEFKPCEITIEETGETSALILSGIRVPEHDGGWMIDASGSPPPGPPQPLPPAPPVLQLPPELLPPEKASEPVENRAADPPPPWQLPREPELPPEAAPHRCPPATRPFLALLVLGWTAALLGGAAAAYLHLRQNPDGRDAEVRELRARIAVLEQDPARSVLAAFYAPDVRNLVVGAERSPRGKSLADELRRCRAQAQSQEPVGAGPDDPRNLDPRIASCLTQLAPAAGATGTPDLAERRFWLAAALRAGNARAADQLAASYLAPAFAGGGSGSLTVTGNTRDRVFAFKFLELQVAMALVADRGRDLAASREPVDRLDRVIGLGAFPWMTPGR